MAMACVGAVSMVVLSNRMQRLIGVSALLFAPTILFILPSQAILEKNVEIIPSDLSTAFLVYGAFVLLLLIQAMIQFASGSGRAGRIVLRGIALIATMGLTANAFQSTTDGWPLATLAALDIGALTALVVLFFLPEQKTLDNALAVLAIVFLVQVYPSQKTLFGNELKMHMVAHQKGELTDGPSQPRSTSAPAPAHNLGNVYHIVLDGFQRQAFDKLVATPSLSGMFTEFTYFPEFKSAYWQTHFSMPAIILGEYYNGTTSIVDWAYKAFSTRGLFKELDTAGIRISTYAYYRYYCPDFAASCDSQVERAERSSRFILVDLWFLSLLPPSLKSLMNAPYANGMARGHGQQESFGFSVTEFMGFERAAPIYLHGIHSMSAFSRLLKAEKSESATGRYVFFHALLPHGPYLYGPDCVRIHATRSHVVDYMGQANCALMLVSMLMDELRRLERYDDALIIVHADHGARLVDSPDGNLEFERDAMKKGRLRPFDRRTAPPREWPKDAIASTADALLMVKFPGGDWPSMEATPVGALDIMPTILSHFGISHSAYEGTPLHSVVRQGTKPNVFHFINNTKDGAIPSVFSRFALKNGAWSFEGDVSVAGRP